MATGAVRQVIGTVVDVEFPAGELPEIFNAVDIDMGDGKQMVAEAGIDSIWFNEAVYPNAAVARAFCR